MKMLKSIKRLFKPRNQLDYKPHCLHDWHKSEKAEQERINNERWEYARKLAKGEV